MHLRHSGALPIVGVNTFLNDTLLADGYQQPATKLERSTAEEKEAQIEAVRRFQQEHGATSRLKLAALQQVALEGGNIFAELMETVRHCTLGQITRALYEVGGQYRRNM